MKPYLVKIALEELLSRRRVGQTCRGLGLADRRNRCQGHRNVVRDPFNEKMRIFLLQVVHSMLAKCQLPPRCLHNPEV
jgi:hypothetical protein